jgi:hypothetical protein
MYWFVRGFPVMLLTLAISSLYCYVMYVVIGFGISTT